MTTRIVSATRIIDATPEVIFDILADPAEHLVIDGSGTVISSKSNPRRLALGDSFSMSMKLFGLPYTTKNIVCELEENHVIAWHHVAQFIWRYQLDPVEGGTKVTETFDYSKPWGVALIPTGIPEKNRAGMERTLERLDNLVTTGSAD
jgi:hypothetical protein